MLRECNTPIKTNKDLLEFINERRQTGVQLTDSISALFNSLPPIYEKVTVNDLMNACFDKGEVINKKLITDQFIYNQGIWLTYEEKKDLTETDKNGRIRNRMEVIKERLCLNPEIHLKIIPTGLTFNEFRSLVQMSPVAKISSLSTVALKTLRDKILLILDNDLEYPIQKWTQILSNIERVAEYKNWDLN